MPTIGKEYLETAIRRLKYYKHLAEQAFDQLEEKDLHFQPSSESNTIAVIVQHMAGNMLSRWTDFLTSDGEKEWRKRDDEFEIHSYSRQQLIDLWERGWTCFIDALQSLNEDDLLKIVYIRKGGLRAIDGMRGQLAHYRHHMGQILYAGKIIKNESWKSLSIPKGHSENYNKNEAIKDPAKKY